MSVAVAEDTVTIDTELQENWRCAEILIDIVLKYYNLIRSLEVPFFAQEVAYDRQDTASCVQDAALLRLVTHFRCRATVLPRLTTSS